MKESLTCAWNMQLVKLHGEMLPLQLEESAIFWKSLLRKWNSYKTLIRLCLFNVKQRQYCKESFAWPLLTLCEEISDSPRGQARSY